MIKKIIYVFFLSCSVFAAQASEILEVIDVVAPVENTAIKTRLEFKEPAFVAQETQSNRVVAWIKEHKALTTAFIVTLAAVGTLYYCPDLRKKTIDILHGANFLSVRTPSTTLRANGS